MRISDWSSDVCSSDLNTCMDDTRAQPEDNGIVSAPSRDCRMSMAPSASPRSAGHILLVEDDAEISRMLRQVLSENGFTTTCVMSPTDMEPVLARGNVDLMVLDVMLPGEDGFSICRRLRATSGIPIIMLTALGEDVNRIVGLEIGADD